MTSYAFNNVCRNIFQHFQQVNCKVGLRRKIIQVQNRSCALLSPARHVQNVNKVTSIDTTENGQFVTVAWNDGHSMKYPYIWLRDNCHCEECFDLPLMSRKYLYKDLDLDDKLKLSEHKDDGELIFHGSNGHKTSIQSDWLRNQEFGRVGMGPVFKRKLWGSDLIRYLPKFQFNDVMTSDKSLYEWMKCIKVHGMAWINGALKEEDELKILADRVGHIRQTFYGVIFGVKSIKDTYFPGYTPAELPLHTDYTFGSDTPGVVMFHGIEKAPSGGKSMFVDGFKIAEDMKASDPVGYELLRTGVMSYGCTGFDCGRDFDHKGQSKIIHHDWNGNVDKISFSQHVRREGLGNLPLEKVRPFYEAVKKFASMVYSPENLVKVMIEEGDIVTLDNFRVLHGRESFTIEVNRGRTLHGTYFDQDDFNSCLRILGKHLIKENNA